ncbi:hypothetical protein AB6A40_006708 [Gnathostoma spinigerum]|uniref:GPI ethanolamine phosphate transferase 3 n=1 Tax=Gnathostoma spinigerum TaxID=75299 RepID=A0ABD6ERT5_9BILA
MKFKLLDIIFLICSYLVSLLLFQHGFLLKRVELPNRSSCSDVSGDRHTCWLPAQYKRAIIVLIDALRYDFLAPYNVSNIYQPYLGHFPTVYHLLTSQEDSSALFHFRADPPTTTLQRLKAITTGSLPTFIDVSANFASSAVCEDNWIDQLVSLGRNLTMLGDDTWISLYPHQFARSHHCPSFDVADLDSVDEVIIDNIYNEMMRPEWSVLVAHFLGVDHCGHKYGPNHPEMIRKLTQMNAVLKNVTEMMEEDTVLFVMGDHGMTETGDHGGEGENEVDAALWVYSKKRLLYSPPSKLVYQVDFVPTLSLLLDFPIPYSNVGIFMETFIPLELRSLAMSANVWQMVRYAQTMVNTIPSLGWILRHFEAGQDSIEFSRQTIGRLQSTFRSSWTQFNMAFVKTGVLSLIDSFLINLLASYEISTSTFSSMLLHSAFLFLQFSVFLRGEDDFLMLALDLCLSISVLSRLVYFLASLLSFTVTLPRFLSFVLLLVHSFSLGSNSFVVFESSVVRYLAQSILLISLITAGSVDTQPTRMRITSFGFSFIRKFGTHRLLGIVVMLTILRCSTVFEACREEQQNSCVATILSIPLARAPHGFEKVLRFFVGVLFLGLTCIAFHKWLTTYVGGSIVSSLIFPVAVAIAGNWLFLWLPESTAKMFGRFSLVTAWVVYALFFTGLFHTVYASLSSKRDEIYKSSVCLLILFFLVMSLLLGDGLVPSFASLIVVVVLSLRYINDDFVLMVFLTLLTSHGFFALGHQPTFQSIPWQAAFIGVPGNFFLQFIPGFLVICHIFSCHILVSVSLPFLVSSRQRIGTMPLTQTSFLFLLLQAVKVVSVCIVAVVQRRHLMLWKIFAPNFIYEVIAFGCVSLFVLFVNCIVS